MKALILNSGLGSRMGGHTRSLPKCMVEVNKGETILSRQLRLLLDAEVTEVVMTTGAFAEELERYCRSLGLPLRYHFVYNERYAETNYIYSIYCARALLGGDGIVLMHGDLVFDARVLRMVLACPGSCMAVGEGVPLPQKDFKAVIRQGRIEKVGVEFFEGAVAAQPLYKLEQGAWQAWLGKICEFCERGQTGCYAESALNEITGGIVLKPCGTGEWLCSEVDTEEDLAAVRKRVQEPGEKTVYMAFSTDIIHSGHIEILKKAARLGKVTVGVLSDRVVASYKRFPLVPYGERRALVENLKEVYRAVEQDELSYKKNILAMRPDYVVHGDDWREGLQRAIREEVIEVLGSYGGELVEFPYSENGELEGIRKKIAAELSIPDFRRGRLKKLIEMKGCVNAIEVHNGITGLIAENTKVEKDGKVCQFDAMWASSLCDSVAKGKPDIEVVDIASRLQVIDDIMEVTTKPVIFDGDTGGQVEHFTYTVRTLERMGVSMIIIEDKTGLKQNSLFGTEVEQTQDSIESFCAKIRAGERAKKTDDFMIVARIESLILEKGMQDALGRAHAYVRAGADGIMIHSRRKEPDEVFEFVDTFRRSDPSTPIVVVPTTFNGVTEEEFLRHGVNVVIYANQLTRSGLPAMRHVAEVILENGRAREADELCMPVRDIISLIPVGN